MLLLIIFMLSEFEVVYVMTNIELVSLVASLCRFLHISNHTECFFFITRKHFID